MLCQSHIIDVCLLRTYIIQKDRVIPETEIINSVITLCHAEEGLSVISLNTGNQIILSV